MKKLFTTICVIALTSFAAQAQSTDATDRPAKKNQVKKEAPAKLMNADEQEAKSYTEAEKKAHLEAREEAKKAQKQVQATSDANKKGTKRVVKADASKKSKPVTKKARVIDPEKLKKDNLDN